MTRLHAIRPLRLAILATMPLLAVPARADLVLSQVIIDLSPARAPRDDIEASNSGSERIYVVAEPAEIQAPGTAAEGRVPISDPGLSGLLVTPQRMILEPGERKLIRVAAIGPRPDRDRVYRVTIKPVVGGVAATATALKVLVGYDALVIVRPPAPESVITGVRSDDRLVIANTGNSSAEIYDGTQCPPDAQRCLPLPSRRLYPGASFTVQINKGFVARYSARTGETMKKYSF